MEKLRRRSVLRILNSWTRTRRTREKPAGMPSRDESARLRQLTSNTLKVRVPTGLTPPSARARARFSENRPLGPSSREQLSAWWSHVSHPFRAVPVPLPCRTRRSSRGFAASARMLSVRRWPRAGTRATQQRGSRARSSLATRRETQGPQRATRRAAPPRERARRLRPRGARRRRRRTRRHHRRRPSEPRSRRPDRSRRPARPSRPHARGRRRRARRASPAFARRRRASRRDAAAADRAAARAAADARWDRVDETAAVDADERRRRRSSDASVSTTTETTDSLASDVAAEAVEEDPTETDDVTVKPGGMSWSSPARPRARAVAVDDAAAKAAEAAAVERVKVASGGVADGRDGASGRGGASAVLTVGGGGGDAFGGGDDDAVGVASTNGETRRRARSRRRRFPPGAHPRGAHSRGAHPPLRARGRERGHRPRRGGSRARARGFVVAREGGRRGCRDPSRIPIRRLRRIRPGAGLRRVRAAFSRTHVQRPRHVRHRLAILPRRRRRGGIETFGVARRGGVRARLARSTSSDARRRRRRRIIRRRLDGGFERARDGHSGGLFGGGRVEAPASLTMVDVLAAAAAATSPRRVRRAKTRREKKLAKLPFAAAGAAIRGVKRAGGGLVRGVGGGLLRGVGGVLRGLGRRREDRT